MIVEVVRMEIRDIVVMELGGSWVSWRTVVRTPYLYSTRLMIDVFDVSCVLSVHSWDGLTLTPHGPTQHTHAALTFAATDPAIV